VRQIGETVRFREPVEGLHSTYGVVASLSEKVTRIDARPSDAVLVLAARDGDAKARETLFRRHVKLAAGLGYRLLGSDDEVDDVVQDAFVTAFDKMGSLKDPQAFASWLSSIVVGKAVGIIRRRRLLHRLGLRRSEVYRPEAIISRDAPPDVATELRAVCDVIARLPTDARVILILRRVDELTLEEVAEQTGWSLATVKRRLVRAEALLAERLAHKRGSQP
jgi:RNA polymerase sigma-70 factor (ECF subfamily)